MIRVAHVLCPVDFSDISRRALHFASALAHSFDARLTVLHLVPLAPVMDVPPLVLDEKGREEFLQQLRRFAATVPADVTMDLRVEQSESTHEAIRSFASGAGVDLLVMGSHGRSGVTRILLGSVAERVIRQAPCPTLIVPARAHDVVPEQPVRFQSILCPVDFSDNSLLAAEYAVNLAEEADAQLRLLHVVSMPPELDELETSLQHVRSLIYTDRLRRLDNLIPVDATSYCSVLSAVRTGVVHKEILAAAAEHSSDLIVLGAHGRGGVDAMFFGSNAARVARAASCPVLVVRPVSSPASVPASANTQAATAH
jgi:nucleotide-binding universal stress UspA family protein